MTVSPTRAVAQEMIDDVLTAYPPRARKARARQVKPNDPEGSSECSVKVQHQVPSRGHDQPGLRLRRLEGRGVGANQGYGPHQPRSGWMRPVFLGYPAQLRQRYPRRRHLRCHAGSPATSPSGTSSSAGTRNSRPSVRRSRNCSRWPRESRCSRMPDRPDRRRHRRRRPLGRQSTGIPVVPVRCEGFGRSASPLATTSPTTRSGTGLLGTGQLEKQTPYDVSIIGDYNIGGDGWASRRILRTWGCGWWPVDRRLHHQRARQRSSCEGQSHSLLPIDELHLHHYGGALRHSLAGVQLLRPHQNHQLDAVDRRAVR